MSKVWVVHEAAATELAEAIAWYEREADRGHEFVDLVEHALGDLARNPLLSSPVHGGPRSVRRFLLDRFPYAIVFVEREHELLVVAIAHQRRRPGYWKRRLT